MMEKGQNSNAPKRGDIIKVAPIRDLKAIKRIKALLANKPTQLALFQVGINTAFRAGDLLRLTPSHLIDGAIVLREEKTDKVRRVSLNAPTLKVLSDLQQSRNLRPTDTYFSGQRGTWTVMYVNRLVKEWCRDVGLVSENYGSHSLRKTWGYSMRVHFKAELPLLMSAFGHSNQQQTLAYLGIENKEIQDLYQNVL